MIAMPGSSGGGQHGGEAYAAAGGGQHQMPGSGAAAMQNMPAIIACPNCSMRLQPPPVGGVHPREPLTLNPKP